MKITYREALREYADDDKIIELILKEAEAKENGEEF